MRVSKKMSLTTLTVSILASSWNAWSIPTFYSKKPAHYHGRYYLQVTACHHRSNAEAVAKKYKKQHIPVKIQHHGNFYIVLLGPMGNGAHVHQHVALKHRYHQVSSTKYHSRHYPSQQAPVQLESYRTQRSSDEYIASSMLHDWYGEIMGGVALPMLNSPILVDNGSNFPAPSNVDTYTTQGTPTQGTLTVLLGKRFPIKHSYLKDYSLGLRYQYLASTNVGKNLTQYTLSQFYNYNYSLNSSINALTLDGKLRTKPYHYFIPFLHAGVGISFNDLSGYQETALPPVTTRISPNFASNSSTQFTFHVGAGTEVQIEKNLNFVFSYEYANYGPLSTGPGTSTWSGGLLHLGTYQANTVLFGLNYTME